MNKEGGLENRGFILIISVLSSSTSMVMANPARHSGCSYSGTKVVEVTSHIIIDLRPHRQEEIQAWYYKFAQEPMAEEPTTMTLLKYQTLTACLSTQTLVQLERRRKSQFKAILSYIVS